MSEPSRIGGETHPPFLLSATVDFPDDVRYGPYSLALLDAFVAGLRSIGVRRLYWIYYGDVDSASPLAGNLYSLMEHGDRSIEAIGEPVKAGVEAAHRHGVEVYAVLKPYNGGLSSTVPDGAAGGSTRRLRRIGGELVQAIPFLERNPHTRMRHRPSVEVSPLTPVREIRLRKHDASPTRVTAEDLEIWVSDDNHRYRRKNVTFGVHDTIAPAPNDIVDYYGRRITSAGDPVRTLRIGPLDLTDRYILVTTRFGDTDGDFTNTALGMVEAVDAEGAPIPIVVATRTAMQRSPRDFRTYGLEFDSGFGPQLTTLDVATDGGTSSSDPGDWWKRIHTGGVIAFARGKNAFLPATPCEMYPEVRRLWSDWVSYLVGIGVDGIDVRVSQHGSLADEPTEYGFNGPALDAYERAHGALPTADLADLQRLSEIRGRHFTDFMRETSETLRRAGVKFHAHVHTEAFRPDPCHGQMMGIPANVDFEWQTWVDEGLLDGVTLRASWFEALEDPVPGKSRRGSLDEILADPVVVEVLDRCASAGLPVQLNRYIDRAVGIDEYLSDLERTFHDSRFSGFDIYETAHILRPIEDGSALEEYRNRPQLIGRKARELGLS